MTNWQSRSVLSEYKSLGDTIRLARLRKKLSIKQIAKKLKVTPAQVEALEEENYKALPAGVYGQIFFKRYANLLNLDTRALMKVFLKDRHGFSPAPDSAFANKVVRNRELFIYPKLFRNLIFGILIVAGLWYLGFYFKKISTAPDLEVWQPAQNITQTDLFSVVSGQTEKESQIFINGELVLADKNGVFSKEINLKKGVNLIIISAKKKYGQERVVSRQILVE